LTPLLSEVYAKKKSQEISLIVAVAMRSYFFISVLMVLSGLVLTIFIPDLVQSSQQLKTNLQWGVGLTTIGFLLFPLMTLQVLAQVSERGYIVNTLILVQNISINILSILFAYLGFSIAGQFAAILLGGLPLYFGLTIFFARLYPNIFPLIFRRNPKLTSGIQKKLWNLNWTMLIINICGRFSLMTDNIIVAGILGPGFVVPFFLTQRLPSLASIQTQSIVSAGWPALVSLYHEGKQELLAQKLTELTKLSTVLGVAILIPVSIYNSNFVSLWVGKSNFAGESLTIFAGLNALLLSIFSLWTNLLIGMGGVSLIMPVVLWSAGINLLLSISFTFYIGISGPLVGTFIAFITTYLWWLPCILQREINVSAWALIEAVLKPLLLGVALGFCLLFTKNLDLLRLGWFNLILKTSFSCFSYLSLSFFLLLNANQKTELLNKIRRIKKISKI
jgi:O-antigen/teichoic acid export membrane protein